MKKVRLGAVSYLNTRPLTLALERERAAFELSYAVPAGCAADLGAGRTDVGLIPSIEYARSPEPYCIVPEVAIACRGEVLSVKLFFRGALERIGSVAVDRSSRTSAALARILLREQYGLEPEFLEAEPCVEAMLQRADAALLIGDPVFRLEGAALASADLGRQWWEWTGLPFVFAFWAGRPRALSAEQVRLLVRARREGQERLGEIARDYARELEAGAQEGGVRVALFERYLREHIHFELGEAELEGLRRFYGLARHHGLIDSVPPLRFYAG